VNSFSKSRNQNNMEKNDTPLLRGVRVAAPCHESWDAMPGSDRVRSCARCQHKVYNLSELTTDEAETLLRSAEGRLCVRFYRRADGTVMTKDCSVGVTARRSKRLAQATAGVAAAVGTAAALLRPQPTEAPIVGKMALPVIQTMPAPEPPHVRMGRATMGAVAPRQELGELAISNPKTLDTNR
jgi:hypothetical protein